MTVFLCHLVYCKQNLHVDFNFLFFRQKTLQIEKLKIFIKNSVREAEEEKQALQKYRKEIGLLLQEKMAHVEELRLIHTDINTVGIS